jgi:ATP-dependent protease ClpP protease subunit
VSEDKKSAKARRQELDNQLKELELKIKAEELRKAAADAAEAEHIAALRGLERADEERAARANDAVDDRNGVLWIDTGINALSASIAIHKLRRWHRTDPTMPIEIIIKSPGGSVVDGMALFDEIVTLSERGGGSHHITTKARGFAASMAGILLQAGDTRLMGPESFVLIHEISSITAGRVSDIKDDIAYYEKTENRIRSIFLDRSGGKITKAQFDKGWKRTDWWLDSDECLKYGFVDAVA